MDQICRPKVKRFPIQGAADIVCRTLDSRDSKQSATVQCRTVPGHRESRSVVRFEAQLCHDLSRTAAALHDLSTQKDSQTVVSALIKQAKTIPNELYKSLTRDRGKELAGHRAPATADQRPDMSAPRAPHQAESLPIPLSRGPSCRLLDVEQGKLFKLADE
jgi:hypothetical protein